VRNSTKLFTKRVARASLPASLYFWNYFPQRCATPPQRKTKKMLTLKISDYGADPEEAIQHPERLL